MANTKALNLKQKGLFYEQLGEIESTLEEYRKSQLFHMVYSKNEDGTTNWDNGVWVAKQDFEISDHDRDRVAAYEALLEVIREIKI